MFWSLWLWIAVNNCLKFQYFFACLSNVQMYFNLTAFCIDSARNLTSQYLIRDHMVFHYNRILSAKGKNVHIWMNCLPLYLVQPLRKGSYQEGINWIVESLLFFLFLTQMCQQGDVAATLVILLYYWNGRFCMKTFSLSVTKDPTIILEHLVLY